MSRSQNCKLTTYSSLLVKQKSLLFFLLSIGYWREVANDSPQPFRAAKTHARKQNTHKKPQKTIEKANIHREIDEKFEFKKMLTKDKLQMLSIDEQQPINHPTNHFVAILLSSSVCRSVIFNLSIYLSITRSIDLSIASFVSRFILGMSVFLSVRLFQLIDPSISIGPSKSPPQLLPLPICDLSLSFAIELTISIPIPLSHHCSLSHFSFFLFVLRHF